MLPWLIGAAVLAIGKAVMSSDDDYDYVDSDVLSEEEAKAELKKKKEAQKRKQDLVNAKTKAQAFLLKHYPEEEDQPQINQFRSSARILREVKQYSKQPPTEIRKLNTSRSQPKAQLRKLDNALAVLEGLD